MLSYSEIKKNVEIVYQNEPHKVLETDFIFKGRGCSSLQVKLRNLSTGNVISTTFHPSDSFEEADIFKIEAEFIYCHRGKCFFKKENSERFDLPEEQIKDQLKFLKTSQKIDLLLFKNKIININLPIKVHLKIKSAPPGIKAGRAEAGTKQVTLETGAIINVPLFLKEGDVLEINTETQEYVKRI